MIFFNFNSHYHGKITEPFPIHFPDRQLFDLIRFFSNW